MDTTDKMYVAGHRGLVGGALVRALRGRGFGNLLLRGSAELDLREQEATRRFFAEERPDYVFMAAARVGGIKANDSRPADFIADNLQMTVNVMDAAWRSGVKKFLFLGSSCIYPKFAPQPIPESALLTSALEPTNQWYALAKIAGIKLAQAYRRQHGFCAISAMPANLYGPGDNFDAQAGHVIPAMIRRFDQAARSGAESVSIWGSGAPRREFLHVDDLADACLFLMDHYDEEEHVNVGSGEEISILALARMTAGIAGYKGRITTDPSMPDGMPRKLLDTGRLNALGWKASIPLAQGLAETWAWYQRQDKPRGIA